MDQLLYIGATWCGPCRVMKPNVEKIDAQFPDLEVRFLDADRDFEEVEPYDIRSVPTFIHLRDGEEVARVIGARTKEDLIRELSL